MNDTDITTNNASTAAADTYSPVYYTIKFGDTLSGIAKKYKTDIYTLMRLNPSITNPDNIYAGRTIRVK